MLEKPAKIRSTFIMPALGARNENTFGPWCQNEERLNFIKGQNLSDPNENNNYPPQHDTPINRGCHLRGQSASYFR